MSLTIMLCFYQVNFKFTTSQPEKKNTQQYNETCKNSILLLEKKTCNPTFWADYKFAGRSIALNCHEKKNIRPRLKRQASHDFREGTYWRIKDLRIYDLNWKPRRCSPTKGGGGLGGDGGDGGFGQKFWGQVVFNETSDLEGIFDVSFFKRKWAVDNFGLNLRMRVSNTVSYSSPIRRMIGLFVESKLRENVSKNNKINWKVSVFRLPFPGIDHCSLEHHFLGLHSPWK